VDTLVDPVEMISSSHMPAAPRVGVGVGGAPLDGPRGSFPSIDPEAQVQWFSRMPENEPVTTVDVDVAVEISWDEDCDTEPTLILRGRPRGPHA
jgi:hypothetical protein